MSLLPAPNDLWVSKISFLVEQPPSRPPAAAGGTQRSSEPRSHCQPASRPPAPACSAPRRSPWGVQIPRGSPTPLPAPAPRLVRLGTLRSLYFSLESNPSSPLICCRALLWCFPPAPRSFLCSLACSAAPRVWLELGLEAGSGWRCIPVPSQLSPAVTRRPLLPPAHALPCFQGSPAAPQPFSFCLIVTNREEYSQSRAWGGVCQNRPVLEHFYSNCVMRKRWRGLTVLIRIVSVLREGLAGSIYGYE